MMITPNLQQKNQLDYNEQIKQNLALIAFPKELAQRVQAQCPQIGNDGAVLSNGTKKVEKNLNVKTNPLARLIQALGRLFGWKSSQKQLEESGPVPQKNVIPVPPPLPLTQATGHKQQPAKETSKPVQQVPTSEANKDLTAHLAKALEARRQVWEPDDEEELNQTNGTPMPSPKPQANTSEEIKSANITSHSPQTNFNVQEAKKAAQPMRNKLLGEIAGFNKAGLKKGEAVTLTPQKKPDAMFTNIMDRCAKIAENS